MKRLFVFAAAILLTLAAAANTSQVFAASTFSANICAEKPNTGEQNNVWGVTVDADMDVIDAYTAAVLTLSVAGNSNVTLSFNCSTVTDQSRNAHFILTGALTGNISIFWPSGRSRVFSVFNNTSGAFTVTICVANSGSCAGTSQSVAQGQTHGYVSDGTNVTVRESAGAAGVQIGGDLGGTNSAPTVTATHLGSALPVNQGGTGATAAGATAAGNIGALGVANNLGDVASAGTARANLGLGGIATQGDPLTPAHGGTGLNTYAAHQALIATGPSTLAGKTITDCLDTGGSHLNYTQSTDSWSCGNTSSGGNSFTTEASIASASTTDLGALASHVVTITGTSTIASFGSSANTNNPVFFVRFQGALTVTYNATSMIIPGAASLSVQAADTAIVKYEGSGHWRFTEYLTGVNRPKSLLAVGTYCATDGTQAASGISVNSDGRITGLTCINLPAGGTPGGGGGGGGPSCFFLNARVTMRDGRKKALADVRIGDQVSDGRGGWNTVVGLDRVMLRARLMARINGEHWTSCEHPHMRANGGFAAVDMDAIYAEWGLDHDLIVKGGAIVKRRNIGLAPGAVTPMAVGQSLMKAHGPCPLITIELFDDLPEDTPLGNLAVDGSGTYVVDDYVVTGWPNHETFDHETWHAREPVEA